MVNITFLNDVMLLRADENGFKKVGIGEMLVLASVKGKNVAVFCDDYEVIAGGKGEELMVEALSAIEEASDKIELILTPSKGEVH